ncbi:DNA-directed RNA polymerase I II and III subunit RPABC1 [Taenia crassiceps]|uniref:DNA-directed RNA polymerase I II and III subunit RPABC1 n=1 Tax=Taenia crassiceps TaxID=6207 RepID=A0ABR4Q8U4_9CEST
MSDECETYRLWRIKKTILKMCHDRGYLVMQKELDQTLDEFREAVGDPPSRKDLLMVVNHEEDPADMLYVFFPEEDKQDHTYKAILVLRDGGLTPAAKTYTLESFYENELMCFNKRGKERAPGWIESQLPKMQKRLVATSPTALSCSYDIFLFDAALRIMPIL